MYRRFFVVSLFIVLGLTTLAAAAPPIKVAAQARSQEGERSTVSILSIIPAQGSPGGSVTLYGSGFNDHTVAFLGNQEVATTVIGPKQLSFDIPRLAPGLYALFLRRDDGTTSKVYNFSVLPLKPAATNLSPDVVDMCAAGRDREVTITGHNFIDRSQVLFDGAAVRSRFVSETSMAFAAPQVQPGLHQVQVRNGDDAVSIPLGLQISAKPEITSVAPGEEHVNFYDLVIEGRNFQQGSTVMVMEQNSIDFAGGQPGEETRRLGSGTNAPSQREKVIYVNCNRIIYQRYPYSTALKSFRIQIVNPNGEESAAMSVSAP